VKVAVVGRGRVGRGLFAAWERAGVDVVLVAGRAAIPEVDVAVLAVPDGAIAEVAARANADVLLHCAGSLGLEAYRDLDGAALGALHPLVSFADPERPPALEGAAFAIAGPPEARRAARALAEACGAVVLERGRRGVHGAAYHAAAALVANGGAALARVGVGVLRSLGLRKKESELAMAGLLRTVAENVGTLGVPRALTGPVMRGDVDTVRRHRVALVGDARAAYDQVAPIILACAEDLGLDEETREALRRALRDR